MKRPLERILKPDDLDKTFLTIEALFWYNLDFYQRLASQNQIQDHDILAAELYHFVPSFLLHNVSTILY